MKGINCVMNYSVMFFWAAGMAGLVSCSSGSSDFDASGTFEATEVVVSAECQGKILRMDITEGQALHEGDEAGTVDSVQLTLRREQLVSGMNAVRSRLADSGIQLSVFEQQIETAVREKNRIENLLKSEAANRKQLDDITAQIALLEKQLAAYKSTLDKGNQSMLDEIESFRIQIRQVDDQIEKCTIRSPVAGRVLVKYAEKGEYVTPGKPLFRIADTDNMFLRAYITSDQISVTRIGDEVRIITDSGKDSSREYRGSIVWVSDMAEFTPKTVQTRDERANLVYAVKVSVKNDGYLRIGMYGELKFGK